MVKKFTRRIIMERVYEKSKADFISRVMTHMGIGLFITFLTAYLTYKNEVLQSIIFSSSVVFFMLFIVEIGLVVYLTRRIEKMSFASARVAFFLYAVVNGLTLSTIFMAYEISNIYIAFLVASVMFLTAGLIGITIKKDLSTFGQFLFLALIGIIIVGIVNIFTRIAAIDNLITFAGIIIFSGLTAYDMQKIKGIHSEAYSLDGESVAKYSIVAALELYLDFVNLFLYILRLLGRKR